MKRVYKLILATILTIVIAIWLLNQIALSDILAAITRVGPLWLAVSFFLYLLSTTLRAARFKMLLKGAIGLFSLHRIVYLHNLSVNILPSFLGELSFVILSNKTGKVNTGEASAALFVSRFFDILAVFVLTALAMFFVPNHPKEFVSLLWAIAILLGVLFIILVLVLAFKHTVILLMDRIVAALRIDKLRITRWMLSGTHETIHALNAVHGWKMYAWTAAVSLGVWLLAYMQVYVLMLAMGYTVTFMTAALGTSLFRLASNLPVYGIGGFGTVELTWTVAFVLLGLSKEAAIVSGFSVHIITLAFAILLGAFASFSFSASHS